MFHFFHFYYIGIDLLVTVKSKDSNKIYEEKEYDEINNDINEVIVENNAEILNESELSNEIEVENEQSGCSLGSETCTNNAQIEENNEEEEEDDDDNNGDDDDKSSEQELTNLGWLIDLKNLAQWPVDSNASSRKSHNGNTYSTLANGISSCIMNDIDDDESTMAPVISEKDLSEERFKKFTIQVKQ